MIRKYKMFSPAADLFPVYAHNFLRNDFFFYKFEPCLLPP